jgi:LPS sulfotransferase NodH
MRRGSTVLLSRAVERRLVWMFGSPRSGSTWLLNILRAMPGVAGIDEPNIGLHLAPLVSDVFASPAASTPLAAFRVNDVRGSNPDYFFAEGYASLWRAPLRRLLLERLGVHLRESNPRGRWCIVKEPNGSQAADLVLDLLPRSRLLFVLRDGRDVVDSELDAAQKGSWRSRYDGGRDMTTDERVAYAADRATHWAFRTELVADAYDKHDPELRHRVTYEQLRSNTVGEVGEILRWLGVDSSRLEETVAALAFERIPVHLRGSKQFARAATPGMWQENLSADEQRVVTDILRPTLQRVGYSVEEPSAR